MKQTLLSLKKGRNVAFLSSLLCCTFSAMAQAPDSTASQTYQRHNNLIIPAAGVQESSFNKGFVYSPEQLVNGKIAGLNVGQNSGQPGADASLMLHNYNTIFGINQPLIVLDGQVILSRYMGTYHSLLSFINPEDLASIEFVTADAAIAVYGEQAANGVLFLHTKQPNGAPKVSYSGKVAVARLRKKVDVLDATAFSKVIRERFPEETHLLGTHKTDWQDVIFRDAVSHDHHVSVSGAVGGVVPYRISAGHQNQQGIMVGTWNKRNTLALRLSPELLNKQLQLNVNLLGSQQDARIAAPNVYHSALLFDPTQPVYDSNSPGGYFIYRDADGRQNTLARNPLQELKERPTYNSNTSLAANASSTYAPAILPGLRVGLQYGYQDYKLENIANYRFYFYDISEIRYFEDKVDYTHRNHNGELKLSYELPQLVTDLDITTTAGLALNRSDYKFNLKNQSSTAYYYTENEQETFFGQVGLLYKQAYRLAAVYASQKNSSIIDSYSQSGISASADLVKNGMLQSDAISSLRLYGSYLNFTKPQFATSAGNLVNLPDINPENVQKFIVGTSASFMQDKLQTNLFYTRSHTKDMWLLIGPRVQDGYELLYRDNLSDLSSNTLNLDVNYQALRKGDFSWNLNTNLSYSRNQINKITHLDRYYYNVPGQSYLYQFSYVLKEGMPANSFLLLDQLYDSNGKPINNPRPSDRPQPQDQTLDPAFIVGLGSELSYKKFSLGLLFRGQAGNYVYNLRANNQGAAWSAIGSNFLKNLNESYLRDGFDDRQPSSTHYLENASFIRLEYLQLGYNVGNLWKDRANLSLTATAQNAFVITKYSGQDPEVSNGIDYGQYPNPTTFSLGLKLDI